MLFKFIQDVTTSLSVLVLGEVNIVGLMFNYLLLKDVVDFFVSSVGASQQFRPLSPGMLC